MDDGPDVHAYDECRYEEYRERVTASDDEELEADAYEPDDPKSPDYHERMSSLEDVRA